MKKLLLFIAGLFMFPMMAFSEPNYNTSEEYYIQGVSSSQDIGGVEAYTKGNEDPYGNPYLRRVCFKNYRDYAVQVYFEFTYGHPDSGKPSLYYEGSIILGAGETKCIEKRYNSARNIKMIVRRL